MISGTNHTNMGNTHTVYVVGEVDFRVLKFDRPLLRKSNLTLRYPRVINYTSPHDVEKMPIELSVDYDAPLTIEHFMVPQEDCQKYCLDGSQLRHEDKTRIVCLEGQYNSLYGYTGMKVVQSKVVPITRGYAMK